MTKRVSLLTVLALDSWSHINVFYFIADRIDILRITFLRKRTQILIYCQTTKWND